MVRAGRAEAGCRQSLPRAAASCGVLLVGLILAGCNGPDQAQMPTTSASAVNPGSMNGNASDEAKAIMARADAGEPLTRFDLDEAAANAMDCLEAAGITPGLRPPAD